MYLDSVGLCYEVSDGGSAPRVTYAAVGEGNETHEAVALGRYNEAAPGAVGWLEAVLSAIGDQDNQIGGFRVSRLLDPVDIGDDVFPCENVQDWQAAGRVAIDGVVYSYTSRGPGRLSGITHVYHGDVVRGARKLHYRDAPILDLGNPYNALQTLRRAFLVESAESEDLNAVGRNLGVYRYPYLPQDETYRRIIQAMAYNPRGTMRGIKLALDAMVGAGNYTIKEDLLRYPCTIFIQLLVAALLEDRSIGHAYLQGDEDQILDEVNNRFPMQVLPVSRGHQKGAHWRDMGFLHSFAGSVRPSDVLEEDYAGDPGTALWQFTGANETTQVLPGADYTTLVDAALGFNDLYYSVFPRADFPGFDQELKATMLFCIPSGFCQNNDPNQLCMIYSDGWMVNGWGVRYTGGQYLLSLISSGTPVGTDTVLLPDTWYEVTLEKRVVGKRTMIYADIYHYGRHEWVLLLNGREVSTSPYWLGLPGAPTAEVSFGARSPSTSLSNVKVYIKHVGFQSQSRQDFGEAFFITGSVGDTGANRLSGADAGTFRAEDIGKRVSIRYCFVLNSYGGYNNGDFVIQSRISDTEVELWGAVQEDAVVLDSTQQIQAADPVFQFPDDLGRKIVISGSILGNNGTYTIKKLFQMGTGKDLSADFDTPIREKTNWCEVEEAVSFVAEGNLTFHTEPNFVSEAAFYYVSDGGAVELDTGLPYLDVRGLYMGVGPINLSGKISYSRVLTGQVLGLSDLAVEKISDDPLRYSWYPFFITDPLGFVRAYLEDLTAAGVIPEYLVEESL